MENCLRIFLVLPQQGATRYARISRHSAPRALCLHPTCLQTPTFSVHSLKWKPDRAKTHGPGVALIRITENHPTRAGSYHGIEITVLGLRLPFRCRFSPSRSRDQQFSTETQSVSAERQRSEGFGGSGRIRHWHRTCFVGADSRSRHEKRTSDRGARRVRTLAAWACITILKQGKEQ